ncbi:MAG: PDZ domain-containing protein [Chthonomonadales bacterium]
MFSIFIALALMQIDAQVGSKATVVVPFELMPSGHIAINATINGEGPIRLGFDTGSPMTFINKKTGVKIGVVTGKVSSTPTMLPTGQSKVRSFSLGGADAGAISVLILDHPIVEFISQVEGGLNGLVGYSYFSKFVTTIDYAAKTISFLPNNYQPTDVVGSVMKRYMKNSGDGGIIAPAAVWGFSIERSLTNVGVQVTKVRAGSPSDGILRPGDRILTIDGRWTDSIREAFNAVSVIEPGAPIEVKILRGKQPLKLRITPARGI